MVRQDTVEPGGPLGLSARVSSPMPRGVLGEDGAGLQVPVHVEGLQARLCAVGLWEALFKPRGS